MKQITRIEMIEILNGIKGAKPVTFEFSSPPNMLAKSRVTGEPNPFRNDISKVRRYNTIVNFIYENSVNRQRDREDKTANFVAGTNWGEHVGDNRVVIENKDKFYIQCKLEKVIEQHYQKISNGALVNDEALAEFFSDRKGSEGQGLDKEVMCIRILADNITAFTHNKERYEIID
jgi:hypothetical protein